MATEISQVFPGTQQTKSPGTASVPLFLLVYTAGAWMAAVSGFIFYPALQG